MGAASARLDGEPTVRAIILTGAGPKFFSAGWDLSAGEEFDSDYGVGGFGGFPELRDRSTPAIAAANGVAGGGGGAGAGGVSPELRDRSTPVIAAVNVMAVGGGFEIAMAADLIVAADHAQFWLPEPALGVLPDAGAGGLARARPPPRAP